MSAHGGRAGLATGGLIALACLACGVVLGAAYSLFAPPLAPFAPIAFSGWAFALLTFAAVVALGVGLGHTRPRVVMLAAPGVAALGTALFAAILALPLATAYGVNAVGLINYAITQAAFAFFVLLTIAFPAAMVGMLASYFWNDR